MPERLNVVFIMTDQQAWQMLRCNGSDFVETPNLDRLAASGCRFPLAYTTTPVCTPARAALFSGMFASSSGASWNQAPLYPNVRTIGEVFQKGGVRTGYIGKWHLDGWEGGYYGTGECPAGFADEWWYDGRRFVQEVGKDGFDKWRKGKNLKPEDCWGRRAAERAGRFIEKHREEQFFLVVSFDEPHGPSSAPEEFYEMYRGTTRPYKPNMGDTLEGKPATHRALAEYQKHGGHVEPGVRPNNSPRYFGCNTFVDAQVGRVVEAVERHCPENTVIIYTVDHGDHQGSHGLIAKGATMYEEIIRVPLIVRAPGLTKKGSVSSALVSQIDLAPTLCRLAGVEPDEQFHGAAMDDMLIDPEHPGREAVFLEYNRFGLPHHTRWGFTPVRCVRTRRHKLALYLLDETDELYDLEEDPDELENRIDDPALAKVRNELHDLLLEWMDRRVDPFRGNGWWSRPWRKKKVMPPGHAPAYGMPRRFGE